MRPDVWDAIQLFGIADVSGDATRRQLRPLAGRFHVADAEAAFTAYETLSERRSEGKLAMFAFPHRAGTKRAPQSAVALLRDISRLALLPKFPPRKSVKTLLVCLNGTVSIDRSPMVGLFILLNNS